MAQGSFTAAALADLTADDVERMLALDETLFVEHKGGLDKQPVHGLTAAVASFANTFGGWLLLGVRNGVPDPHLLGSWVGAGSPPLVDVIRDRLRGELDPLPAFEARVVEDLAAGPVGVVRVYESADTPHIAIRTGSVFVREVAGVSDASARRAAGPGAHGARVYRAQQIRSRAQLAECA